MRMPGLLRCSWSVRLLEHATLHRRSVPVFGMVLFGGVRFVRLVGDDVGLQGRLRRKRPLQPSRLMLPDCKIDRQQKRRFPTGNYRMVAVASARRTLYGPLP